MAIGNILLNEPCQGANIFLCKIVAYWCVYRSGHMFHPTTMFNLPELQCVQNGLLQRHPIAYCMHAMSCFTVP